MTVTSLDAHRRTMIMNASPERQITMVYDRLLLDLERAIVAQEAEQWWEATNQLSHARQIVDKLTEWLNVEAWAKGQRLLDCYLYLSTTILHADTRRSIDLTKEAVGHVRKLHSAWHEAALEVAGG